jgi:hypothetical protein
VEVVGWGERIVGAAVDAAADAGSVSGGRRCRRCYDDTAVVGVTGYGEIVQKRRGTELSVHEIGDGEGDAGVEGAEEN